jgi:hypothetical protein
MRIYDNAGLYFSKHFFAFFGLRDIVGDAIGILTIFVIALIALAFYFSWKTNKFYRLIGLVVTSFFLLSFVSIQTIWDSPRLGIPYFPLLSIFIFGALYSWAEIHKKGVYKVVLAGSLILLSLTTFKSLGVEIKKDRTSISNYLRGRDLVGYTPDWVNYINMSRYAAKQLPTDKVIACRKPEISFLQTGREFYGIYRIPMHNAKAFFDSIIANQRPYIIIDEDLLESKKLPTNIVRALKSKLNAIFAGANNDVNNPKSYFFGVYFPETAADSALFQQLPQVGISLITSYPAIAQQLAQERAEMNVIYPDELLNELRTHNVGYVIMGSLRKYESQKTEFTINTERRFLYYIEQKYPNSLVQLYQIGIDEQAYLFQLRYPNQASPK